MVAKAKGFLTKHATSFLFVGALVLVAILGTRIVPDPVQSDPMDLQPSDPTQINRLARNPWILHVDSYHEGYPWSDGIAASIRQELDRAGVESKRITLDTKRNPDLAFLRQAGVKAKRFIEEFKPDVVITSDDNAFAHVIMPYFRDTDLPVVFCGLNWDASIYDAPYRNTTGMIEVALIPQLLEYLTQYAHGSRIGYVAADVVTAHKEGYHYQERFGISLTERYVTTLDQWCEAFIEIQNHVDILIVGNIAGINDWDNTVALNCVHQHTQVPTGSIYSFLMPYSMIGLIKLEEEQGQWAAETALRIVRGASPADIAIVQNQEGMLMLNLSIADELSITFTPSMLRNAKIIN
ncbi:ABC transporter substrate-binding protein [Planctomycetota bacterium]